jgi:hypothetical protein
VLKYLFDYFIFKHRNTDVNTYLVLTIYKPTMSNETLNERLRFGIQETFVLFYFFIFLEKKCCAQSLNSMLTPKKEMQFNDYS